MGPRAWARVTGWTFVLLLGTLCLGGEAGEAAEPGENAELVYDADRVVVLHSYHFGFSWTDSISRGIRSVFLEEAGEVEVKFEFLDTRFQASEAYLQAFQEALKVKYRERSVDVVIACDDNALSFMLTAGQDVFPGVPAVFCSVSGYTPEMRRRMNVTGLRESIDIGSTVETALRLHSGIQEIAVILDKSRTGRALKKKAEAVLGDSFQGARVRYLEDLTVEQLIRKIPDLPENTLVLLFIFRPDETGRVLSHEQNLDRLRPHCPFPIYSVWQFYLGHGIVGGKLSNGYEEGRMTARMALRILDGEEARAIPLGTSPVRYMFDSNELNRFGLPPSALPEGSLIVNQPFSFYDTYKTIIWAVIAVFIALAGIIAVLVFNIIARKRVQETLRDNEQRYRALFNGGADAVFVHPFQDKGFGRLLEVNEVACKRLGYSREELLKLTVADISARKDTVERGGESVRKSLDKEKNQTFEVTHITKEGKRIPVEILSTVFLFKGRKAIMSIARDIRERKKYEETLRRYEHIISSTDDLMSFVDRDYVYRAVNNAYLKAHARSREEIIGFSVAQLMGEDTFHKKVKVYLDRALDGETVRYQSWFEYAGIGWRFMDLAYQPFRDDEGYIEGVVVSVRDISDRKEAEEALQQSEERYRSLVENTLDGYFVCEIPSGRFIFLNQRICDLCLYTVEEGLALSLWDVVDPEEHPRIQERIRARVENMGPEYVSHTYLAMRKDGATFRAEISTSLITYQGKTVVQGVLRDVTEKQRLQWQLQQAQKMEAIGTLAGGIAHDFNNLLMGIQGRAALMMSDVDASSPHTEHLQGIEDYVRSGAELTKQLLGLAHGGKVEVKSTDVNQLVTKTVQMFARTRKEIRIHESYQEDLWAAEADRAQIEQVLLNFFVNAWQAMPGGGDLYLRTENTVLEDEFVRPHSVGAGEFVKISIMDTGVGMDEATRRKVFDPFFTTKGMGRGFGLGLASAYGIIKNHGGFVHVYSERGKGSTFTVYLPASKKKVVEERMKTPELLKGTETVLLVDDEKMVLDVATPMIEKMGYRVMPALGGWEAVRMYQDESERIDIVILDMIMPDMNGEEAYSRLREINPKVRVLLSSGYSMNGQAQGILEKGCDGFIQKPFSMIALSQKLRAILDSP